MPLAAVVPLGRTNPRLIAEMLRDAADSIETETDADDRTKAVVAVQLMESGKVRPHGWGATDILQAMGTLQLGLARMTRDLVDD